MRLLNSRFIFVLSSFVTFTTSGTSAIAEFSLRASAATNSDTAQGASVSASSSFDNNAGDSASASIFGSLAFDGLIGGRVAARDARSFGNFGTSASILGTWSDTIRWTGTNPAPTDLFITINLDGLMQGTLNSPPEGRSISGNALVRVQDGVALREVGVISHSASNATGGFGDFSVTGRFGLRKSNSSDEYLVGFRFEASARANEGFVEVNSLNTFGFVDITLDDGTSVLNQIAFDSGLQPTVTNPIPEPTSMALFGLGLLGVGAVARRRRQLSS